MLRVLVTAVAALRRAGSRESPPNTSMMVASGSRELHGPAPQADPFHARRRGSGCRTGPRGARAFFLAAAPGLSLPGNLYQAFLSLADPRRERAFVAAFPFDVRPSNDDRPFFFRFSHWNHLWSRDPVVRPSLPIMEYSLLVLLAITALAAVLCVYLPPLRSPGPGRGARSGGAAAHPLLRRAGPRLPGRRDSPPPEVRAAARAPQPRPLGGAGVAALHDRAGLALGEAHRHLAAREPEVRRLRAGRESSSSSTSRSFPSLPGLLARPFALRVLDRGPARGAPRASASARSSPGSSTA